MKPTDFAHLNVDTPVQTKAIRYPTDARLCDRARERLVKAARKDGPKIKRSYVRIGRRLVMRQSRYGHARQMNRARAMQRKLKTNVVRVICEVGKQTPHPERKHIAAPLQFTSGRSQAQKGRARGNTPNARIPFSTRLRRLQSRHAASPRGRFSPPDRQPDHTPPSRGGRP